MYYIGLFKEKDSEEEAIKQGVEQGEGLCEQIGLSLGRIVNVEEVQEDEAAAGGDGGEEGEEEEEEPEVTTYKF